ncbi:hypothetical protein BX666DRAFT_2161726 [Dichotomocladium elegans]|nr:hypothetical protein BX666DRAFT_2161726 [Dichotomocladium elegans]
MPGDVDYVLAFKWCSICSVDVLSITLDPSMWNVLQTYSTRLIAVIRAQTFCCSSLEHAMLRFILTWNPDSSRKDSFFLKSMSVLTHLRTPSQRLQVFPQ